RLTGPTDEPKLWADPLREPTDCVIGLWSAAGHHLKGVQHLWEDIETHLDAGLPRPLNEHAAVIDQGFVCSCLQEDRRKSSKVCIERAGVRIAPIPISQEVRNEPFNACLTKED